MIVTSIVKPANGANIWSGRASIGNRRLVWFYCPRHWLHVQEQDHINPKCWMNIPTPEGARDAVLRAIRKTRSPSACPFFENPELLARVG
jgi:hypothetical protein